MAEISLVKVMVALGFGLLLAVVGGFVLSRLCENRGGKGVFRSAFLLLVCVYALGFAARYVVVEVLF